MISYINTKRAIPIGIAFFIMLLYFGTKGTVLSSGANAASAALDVYRDCIGFASAYALSVMQSDVLYVAQTNTLTNQTTSLELAFQVLALRKILYFALLIMIFPLNWKKNLLLSVAAVSFTFLANTVRTSILLQLNLENIWNAAIFDVVFCAALLFIFVYKLKYSYPLKRVYCRILRRTSSILPFSITKTVFIISLYPLIACFVLVFGGDFLTRSILLTVQAIMSIFGYQTIISSATIYLNSYYVYLAHSCLGIELMTLFTVFIYIQSGRLRNRLTFIVGGLIIIILLNITRITYLLFHLNKYHKLQLTLDAHDMFDYAVYVTILLLWILYIKWGSKIHPLQAKNKRNG